MNKLLFLLLLNVVNLVGQEIDLSEPYLFMLDAHQRTSFTSVSNTKVKKIYKRMGDSFEKGELLIQLDDIIQKSLYEKALAVLERVQVIHEAKKVLYQGKVASFDEMVNVKTELIAAESDVKIAKKNLEDQSIIAQYDGRVSYLNVEEAEYPNHEFYYKDKPMMETINEEILIAKILIPLSLLPQVFHGQNVLLSMDLPKVKLKAKVKRISPLIEPASATILIEAEVDNQDKKLLVGMTGQARMVLSKEDDS